MPGAARTGAWTGTGSAPVAVDAVSAERLSDVVPALASRVERILHALAILGHPARVTQGRRSAQEQLHLYQQGRSTPGKIVTNADGVQKRSMHQDGRAVDIVWRTPDGVSYDGPWSLFGEACEAVGLRWGGRFKSLSDRPHCELPYGHPETDE